MAKYLLAYTGGSRPETDAEQEAVMAAWTGWFSQLGAAVVDPGNPFGPSKSVSVDGAVGDGGAAGLSGYSIVSADDLAELRMAVCRMQDLVTELLELASRRGSRPTTWTARC